MANPAIGSTTGNDSATNISTNSSTNTSSEVPASQSTNTLGASTASSLPVEAVKVTAAPIVFKGKPYRIGRIDDAGVPKLKFDFGANNSLGHLVYFDGDKKQSLEARGEVLVPLEAKLTLVCNRVTASDAALLDGFSPSDLWGLVFDDSCNLHNEGVLHIARLDQLKCLTINASSINPNVSITGESLRLLEPLSELRELELAHTGIKGSDFVYLSRLKKLRHLAFSPVTEASALLAALTPSKNLSDLTLEHGPLTAADFKAIATCQNLRHLRVNDTKMTNESMEQISSLPHLKSLEANWSLLDGNCLSSLKKLKTLKDLSVGGNKLDLTDTVKFSTALKVNMH